MSNSEPPHSQGVVQKGGRRLATLDEWHRHAPPKARHNHWKDGRSAKECARAWLDAAPDLPSEISDALHSFSDIGPLCDWCAEPEAKVRIDEFRGPPNIDVLLTGCDDNGPVVVAVEAKADEMFGATIEKTLSDAYARLEAKPKSKGVARVKQLAELFGLTLEQRDVLELRYQLMTVTAAALAEAERRGAQHAIVMVHEFVTWLTTAEKRARNGRDLNLFLQQVFGHRNSLQPGTVIGPFRTSCRPTLYFGKARRTVQASNPRVAQ